MVKIRQLFLQKTYIIDFWKSLKYAIVINKQNEVSCLRKRLQHHFTIINRETFTPFINSPANYSYRIYAPSNKSLRTKVFEKYKPVILPFGLFIKRQSCHYIETSQLICVNWFAPNQLTGFYMMTTFSFNELKSRPLKNVTFLNTLNKLGE